MTDTSHHDARIAQMTFASIYPMYVTKVVKKGRTEAELRAVISWLTGYDEVELDAHREAKTTFEGFFCRRYPASQRLADQRGDLWLPRGGNHQCPDAAGALLG